MSKPEVVEQIKRAMRNRLDGMIEEARARQRPGLKQQLEELRMLVDMWERNSDVVLGSGTDDRHNA